MHGNALKLGALLALPLFIGWQIAAPPASGLPAQTEVHPCTPKSEKLRVVGAYGDSTTFGMGAKPAESMPVVLQTLLCNTQVINEGVSGSTAAMLLNGEDNHHRPWAQEMAASKADIVLVNYGINDTFRGTESAEAYRKTITQLVHIAKKSGKRVILQTPSPVYISQIRQAPDEPILYTKPALFYLSAKRHEAVQRRAEIIRKVAQIEHVGLADANRVMLELSARIPLDEVYSDLHPRAVGYAAIAREVARTVQSSEN